ncbi:MAG TPA: fibronectin type III domain-containing protein, partial [Marinobacter sp.]|nr:fibronectin type III domain-containing protein [Marinobacter sp.]
MPRFPKRQADIEALSVAMGFGYWSHAADFPSSDFPGLSAAYSTYSTARDAQIEAMAAAQVATDEKDGKLAALIEKMKDALKKSEVDVGADSEKLEYIGWGPKAPPSPADAPGQPRNLDAVVQGAGTVLLDWKAPARGSGGTVRTYVIQRRDQPEGGGEFGDWSQAGIALESETTLMTQPRGPQLEYRVKAINTGGESPPSNT